MQGTDSVNALYIKFALTAFLIMLFLCPLFPVTCPPAEASIKLKMAVENPSETEVKTVPVKSYLPKGIKPEDITDRGNFEIGYDFGKSSYYVYQEVTLEPRETITLEITMKDIWIIPTEEIYTLKNHISKVISTLQKTKYYNQARSLSENITKRLDKILERQRAENINVEQRFSDYEADTTLLKEARRDLEVLEDLAIEAGTFEGEEMLGKNPDKAVSVRTETAVVDVERLGTVKFKIQVSNPSAEKKILPLKYYFPAEVKPEYILDSGGLEVGYDYQGGIYYLYKDAVELAPEEKKEYIVEVKDIWAIPEDAIKILREHAERLVSSLAESEYKDTAAAMGNKIISGLDGILAVQKNPPAGVERRIGEYRAALAKLEEAKKDTARLEKLVIQAGGSPGLTLLGSSEGRGADEKRYGKSNLARGAKGLELIGKSIFRGKAPNIATTWKIIYVIIGFLGVASLLFITLQFQQRRSVMFDALTGTFRREYILERLKEEFVIVQKANNKCSILLSDIDNFKNINDTYGHAVGDTVMKEFVIATRQGIRNADYIGRLGGDEFLVILSYVDKDRAQLIAEKVKKLIAEHAVKLKDKTLNITASIGVATYPDDSMAVKELVGRADKAMYKAKGQGGNNVAV